MKTILRTLPVILLLFTACNRYDDLELAPFEPEFALPIINSDIILTDLIEDVDTFTSIVVDPDGLLRLVYVGDTIRVSAQTIFEDLNNFPSTPLPIIFNPLPIPLDLFEGVSIDSAELQTAGLALFNVSNPNADSLFFSLRIPQLERDGVPFEFQVALPPNSSFSNRDNPLDLSGYAIVPDNQTIFISYTATNENGQTVSISNPSIQFSNLTFAFATGTFGTIAIPPFRDTIILEFFENFQGGDFQLSDPSAFIDIRNTVGIPSRVIVSDFLANPAPRPGDPDPESILLEPENLSFDLEYPTDPGDTATTRITIDQTNSNLPDLINSEPVSVEYELDGVINPSGDPAPGYAFADGFIEGVVTLDLPLIGSISNYIGRDTFNLDLEEDLEDAKEASFRLTATNRIPLNINLTVLFEDDQGNLLLTLLPNAPVVVEGAPVNAEGESDGETRKVTDVPLSDNELELVRQSARGILVTSLTTTGSPRSVRLTENERVNIKLGLRAKLDDN
jgi:hypothetical protein